jgi:hypothetical protein
MKGFYHSGNVCGGRMRMLFSCRTVFSAILVVVYLATVRTTTAQVVPSGDAGGFTLAAGGTASGYEVQYGEQNLLGIAAVVDADTRRRIGIEGEARWLKFHETDGLHATTWSIGPRYHFSKDKFQFYVKGLIGIGDFSFPYNYAYGRYLVISPGGGIDYRWRRKVSFRLADFEYQYWPRFTYGAMSSYGVSAGIRYHIF